jgi:hypothetical protein
MNHIRKDSRQTVSKAQCILWLTLIGGISAIAMYGASNARSPFAAGWLLAGAGTLLAISTLIGHTTLRQAKRSQVALFALLASVLSALCLAGAASPAGTQSCPGPSDCDAAFGLGVPFIAAALSPLYLLLISFGRTKLFDLLLPLP